MYFFKNMYPLHSFIKLGMLSPGNKLPALKDANSWFENRPAARADAKEPNYPEGCPSSIS